MGWERITSPFIKETDDELLDFMAGIIEKGARERNLGDKSRHEIRKALGEVGPEIMKELRKLYEDTLSRDESRWMTFDSKKTLRQAAALQNETLPAM